MKYRGKCSKTNKNFDVGGAAFLWMTGSFPDGIVDHIDGDRSNNAWANLREVDPVVNGQNRKVASKRSKSGVLGVHPHHTNGTWIAQIRVGKRTLCLGSFRDIESAKAAYDEAKRKYHPGWAA